MHHVSAAHLSTSSRGTGPYHVEIGPGGTHLFEEEGTLTQAAAMARAWFLHHLGHRSVANRQRRAS